jgi:membrane dipeptidase
VIVDAHNDLLLELVVQRGGARPRLVLRRGEERLFERYWLPKLEAGGVDVQVCPLYGATAPPGEARASATAQLEEFGLAVAENAERVRHATTREDLDDDRLRLVLSMEGLEPLDGDPSAFEEWHGRGVRMVGLTWNHANAFAGGIDSPEQGLSDRGRELVRRLRELGVVLDLAHASEATWQDVLEEGVPFSVSHACCRGVHDHQRNLADWQLEALAECGGVLGVMALRFVVDPDAPTISRLVDHVDHAVGVMGIEHVGLGADFVDQVVRISDLPDAAASAEAKSEVVLEGLAAPDDYPALVTALRARGYDGARLEAIMSENWLRVLRGTLPP